MAKYTSHEVRDRFAGLGLTLMRAAEAAVEVGQGMRTAGRVGNARKNAFIDAVERVEAEIAAIRRYDRWVLKRVKDAVPVDRKPPPPVEAPPPGTRAAPRRRHRARNDARGPAPPPFVRSVSTARAPRVLVGVRPPRGGGAGTRGGDGDA